MAYQKLNDLISDALKHTKASEEEASFLKALQQKLLAQEPISVDESKTLSKILYRLDLIQSGT